MTGSSERLAKAKAFLSRNKPALALIALFLAGGLAALTRLIGPPQRRERAGRPGLGMPVFDAKVDPWKAPSMQRSDPESMITMGGAFGENEKEAAAPAVPKPGKFRPPIVGGAENVARPPIPEFPQDPARPRGKLEKGKGFENSGNGSAGGSGASASAERPPGGLGGVGGAGGGAGAGGGGAGKGPLSTLRRNIAILASRASKALGLTDSGSTIGKGSSGPTVFAAAPSNAVGTQGSGVTPGGAIINGSGAGVTAGGTLPLGKLGGGGDTSGGTGGGSSAGNGTTDGATAGTTDGTTHGTTDGTTAGHTTATAGTTSGTPTDCAQTCAKRCQDAGQGGSNTCLNACYQTNHCDKAGEQCVDPPSNFDEPPNLLPVIRKIAESMPDTVKVACKAGDPNHDKFLDEVIRDLNGRDAEGNPVNGTVMKRRWGYVCKRKNCSTLSEDKIGYYEGDTPTNGSTNLLIIDILQDCGGGLNKPQWLAMCWDGKRAASWTCSRTGGSCASATTRTSTGTNTNTNTNSNTSTTTGTNTTTSTGFTYCPNWDPTCR